MASLALAAAFGAASIAQPAAQGQAISASQQPPKPATALIVGQLVDGMSGSPISGAVIILTASAPPRPLGPDGAPPRGGGPPAPANQPLRTSTDGNGRFVFHSLPAGEYSLSATRSGFMPSAFGQTQPTGGSVRRITLSDGQRLTNVAVKIWKYASISGRLLDEAGEPAVAATLRILRSTGTGESRRYMFATQTETDDRGAYRFSGLAPGDYLVMMSALVISVPTSVVDAYLDANVGGATANQVRADVQATGGTLSPAGTRVNDQLVQASRGRGMATPIIVGDGGKLSVYPMTFFPGVRSIASATIITVQAGQARTNLDFSSRPVPAATVTGRVTGSGGPAPNVTVKLVAVGLESVSGGGPNSAAEVAWAITRSDGTFTALGVPSADYTAAVLKVPVAQAPGPAGRGSAGGGESASPVLWGRTPVTVGETNVEGVAIHLAEGGTVSGRIEFETGIVPPPVMSQLPRSQVVLTPVDPSVVVRPTPAGISADGSFKTPGYPPGLYSVVVSVTAPGWVLKSVMAGGRDLVNEALDLAGPDITGVVATFTDKAGEISGSIVANVAEPEAIVMLLPVDYQASIQRGTLQRRVRVVGGSPTGTYRVTGVLPGDYLVVALPRATGPPDYEDARAVGAVASQATRVTIGEREKRTLSLTLAGGRQP